ncbi:CRISPR-associated protein Csx11 [uncultured Candidatus Kuenenia sp.]|uniref:CRISPR-associated protein Csx11 n=1 Tax=uncultured Candidatus Kuenenia sp. TaxID=1048336 RepID=UPI0002DE81D2|nr:CRISPR-associated protein Csx11 [uncultured Candidatus Kuenenia sp.]
MIDKLNANSNQILFVELAGLLHDIGKLSKVFLEYRQQWQSDPCGYEKDPHERFYIDKHEEYESMIPSDFNKTISEIIRKFGGDDLGEPEFSIEQAIDYHVKPDEGGKDIMINKMLKAADGVDSSIDRNNPLWSAEQKRTLFRSNVFGYETDRVITFESQEVAREKLYTFLNLHLPGYFEDFKNEDRLKILKGIKDAFDKGLADTTRPSNDTTLWEHSYAVASILKVLTVHNLFSEKESRIYDFEKVKFGILGIGWDGMRFMSYGQKIGDIVGRKEVIEKVQDEIKNIIEYECPIGNEVYSDDNGIYFIVPVNLEKNLNCIWNEIKKNIYEKAAKKSEGELQPHIVYIDRLENKNGHGTPLKEGETVYINTLTHLCRAINKMKEKASYRFSSEVRGFRTIESYLKYDDGKTICPVCRLRQVEDEKVRKKLCSVCRERRSGKEISARGETVFIDEIVDKNRRAALITASFVLDDWLNGRRIRSLFVTEANGLEREVENIVNVKQFEKEGEEIKKFLDRQAYGEFKYSRIVADIDALHKATDQKRAGHTAFLYDRTVDRGSLFRDNIDETRKKWDRLLDQAKNEDKNIDIYNLLNAKTPTPSTVLNVWDTTLGFFQDISKNLLTELLPEFNRLRLKLKPIKEAKLYDWGKGTIEAEVVETREKIELLYESGEVEVVGVRYSVETFSNELKGKHIRILDKEIRGLFGNKYQIADCKISKTLFPCRTMTVSPNLFMVIVPADRAVEISYLIYREYIKRFGKVMGRLPFSIGNIFFGVKMPMFVVLDAGKRMITNFDKLRKENVEYTVIDKKEDTSDMSLTLMCEIERYGRTLKWCLPHKLGNCEDDYHHSYFVVKRHSKDYSGRKNYFKTVAGDVIHFKEVEKGDTLCMYPNYYDFEFLDSNTRRHDICLDKHGRRKSSVANYKSKPFLLDELNQKIMCVWEKLLQGKQLAGITDTKLRNLQSLWLTKYQEWDVDIGNKTSEQYEKWVNLVTSSIKKEFKEIDDGSSDLLKETIKNGLFFDTLELYLGILKERIT